MSISSRKLAANRANARKSTGPASEAGRATVSQNATKHGLCGRFKVLAGENQAAFDELFNQFMQDEQPVGSVEVELVRRMAEYTWLRDRASRFQNGCFDVADRPELTAAGQADIGISPQLERFLRYQAHFDRSFARASAELAKRRKDRDLRERGFVREIRAEAQEKRREDCHELGTQERSFRVAAARAKAEREIARNEREFGRSAPPKIGQIAA